MISVVLKLFTKQFNVNLQPILHILLKNSLETVIVHFITVAILLSICAVPFLVVIFLLISKAIQQRRNRRKFFDFYSTLVDTFNLTNFSFFFSISMRLDENSKSEGGTIIENFQ